MNTGSLSPFLGAWYRWKALRLPWRRRFLVGYDLHGNTYWEFRIAGTAVSDRLRRIVEYPRSTHLSEVNVSPSWHQWLRYTRQQPPSGNEQVAEVARQARMRELAAQADARWEAKKTSATTTETGPNAGSDRTQTRTRTRTRTPAQPPRTGGGETGDPWKAWENARQTTEKWQPSDWKPETSDKR